jgi:hypothetical protein
MISAISSYYIPVPRQSSRNSKEILPGLKNTCDDLRIRQFPAIDVLITSDDILSAINKSLDKGDITDKSYADLTSSEYMVVAQTIVRAIHFSIRVKGQFHLKVASLATNIPNISKIDQKDDKPSIEYRKEAIDELAISLLVAQLLDTPVVVIVCGRRIASHVKEQKQMVYFSTSTNVERNPKTELFSDGVVRAYQKAREALQTDSYPRAGVALEMEPDAMALADGPDAWIRVYKYLKAKAAVVDSGDTEGECLAERIGLNLDLGHVMVSIDRSTHRVHENADRGHYINKLIDDVTNIEGDVHPIFHYHIADHALGAHWVDSPLLKFRQPDEYIQMLEKLWYIKGKQRSKYSSGTIAIELEACKRPEEVGNSRNTLKGMVSGHNREVDDDLNLREDQKKEKRFRLESKTDEQDNIERLIGETTIERLKVGWHDGLNRKLYEAVEFLSRVPHRDGLVPKKVSEKLRLFDEITLKAIHNFLAARRNDARTKHAYDVIRLTFAQTGCHSLTHWFEELIDQEYAQSFYKDYRDHSVHVVYVFLTGWYLYRHIPQLRKKLNTDKSREYIAPSAADAFSRKWVLASLAHDFGYIFESEDPDVQAKAKNKINEFTQEYPCLAIFKRDRAGEEGFLKGENGDATLAKTLQASIKQQVDGKKFTEIKTGMKNKNILKPEIISYSGIPHFATASDEAKKFRVTLEDNLKYSTPDLEKFMNLCSSVGPDVRKEGKEEPIRGPYFDHGVMSAMLINHLYEVHKGWSKALHELSVAGHGDDGEHWKQWAENNHEYSSKRFWQDEDMYEVQHAIAVHNIWPECGPKANLYTDALVQKECPKLKTFKYGDISSGGANEWLAMFLGLCDSLQEWDRNRFKSPLDSDAVSLDSLDIHTRVELLDNSGDAKINFSFPTIGKLGDAEETMEVKKTIEFGNRFRPDTWNLFITLEPEPEDT